MIDPVLEPTPLEKAILEDIRSKTGLSFYCVGSIEALDKATADAVLPILVEWLPTISDPNHRHAIYACFHAAHAYRYFDTLVSWWEAEENELASGCLTQILASLAKPADAERLWKLCERRRRPFHYMMLAKLATLPATEREVKDNLAQALEHEQLRLGDLQYISQVSDPRIRKWFETKVDSPERGLRVIAKRVVQRGKRLPVGVQHAAGPPDRTAELFSTEVDLEEVKPLLREVAKDLDLKIPSAIRAPRFLSSLELDRWAVAPVTTAQGTPVLLWFRLEDVDTVELVVTTGAGGARGPHLPA